MTREEIKKRVLSDECYLDSIAELVADIVADEKDYIESRPKFREHEIVWYREGGNGHMRAYAYGSLDYDEKQTAWKLTTEELAHTTAPLDMETWELYEHHIIFRDSDGALCTTPEGTVIRTYCPHDGEAEGTL